MLVIFVSHQDSIDISEELIFSLGNDFFCRRDFSFLDIGFGDSLERGEFFVLLWSDKTDCDSGFSSSSSSSYTVHIAFNILRQGIVDHMSDIVDIDSSGCNISSNEDFGSFVFKLREDSFSLLLEDISVKPLSLVAFFDESSHYIVYIELGLAEDDSIKIWLYINDSTESIEFVFFVDFKVDLRSLRCGHLFIFDRDELVVSHVFFGYAEDFLWHCSGEEEDIGIWICFFEDGFDIIDKSHIEHFISFIENKV